MVEVKRIEPSLVEILPTVKPFELIVILPVPSVISFKIAPVIILLPFDEIFILPSSFVIALDIDKLEVDLFVMSIFPTLLTAPARFTSPVPFWVTAKSPILSISPDMSIFPPPFANKMFPARLVILLADIKSPFSFNTYKSPFLLYIEPLISNPFLDEISVSPVSFVNSAFNSNSWEFPLFWINIPFVASISLAPLNSKMPCLLSISILPSEVLIFDSNLVSDEFVSISILPFSVVISPVIEFEPFFADIKIFPSSVLIFPF